MELLADFLGFALKVLIIVVALGFLIFLVASFFRRSRFPGLGQIIVTHLNHHYRDLGRVLEHAVYSKREMKSIRSAEKKRQKMADKDGKKRVYVVHFDGDIAATGVDELREQVSAILQVARCDDEVVLILESGGGMMQNYGLAASQLGRLREKKIPLTVCVDKVAASGGYLMACLGDKLIAAPFATIGAIGVVVMFPNFHRLLKKLHIDYMDLTAGEFKRTISPLAEVTEKGKEKFMEELESAHTLMKAFITRYRPGVDIDKVSTGEDWYGDKAVELGLVDEVGTSDDYLMELGKEAELYRVDYEAPKTVKSRVVSVLSESADRILIRWWGRLAKEKVRF